ncbi:MAG: NRDE family protein [Haliscomenobacter sp.]|nr:NRDE family protein [Haliscomenobacter sp.]MBK9489945.1 NRDE family protein [Haliscomenobacter sp.]
MCTVTYVSPAPGQFILTSNRDEAPSRGATRLVVEEKEGKRLIFPQDPAAGGTWIAAASNQRMVCLLNGAFEAHNRQTPYRLSRGIMVWRVLPIPTPMLFFNAMILMALNLLP